MKYKTLFVFILVMSGFNNLHAGNPVAPQQFINNKDWSFVQNKGQLTDEEGNLINDVKYYSHEGGAHLYCRPGKISFVFTKIENKTGEDISEATGSLSPVHTRG